MEQHDQEQPEMTVQEAADALGISVRGVQYRLKRGLLPGRSVAGRVWFIPREAVEQAKAAGRIPPGPKGPRRQQEAGTDE